MESQLLNVYSHFDNAYTHLDGGNCVAYARRRLLRILNRRVEPRAYTQSRSTPYASRMACTQYGICVFANMACALVHAYAQKEGVVELAYMQLDGCACATGSVSTSFAYLQSEGGAECIYTKSVDTVRITHGVHTIWHLRIRKHGVCVGACVCAKGRCG